jgi:flagellar biosynthesis/type III secretory pathway chaperone
MLNRLDEKSLFYQRAISIWEDFCHLHKSLYDLSCDEYLTLLESDIDKLETIIPLKEEIISKISDLENERSEFIEKLNSIALFSNQIERSSDLIQAFSEIEQQNGIAALKNLNSLLIDIIQKLQDQNKKNQVFLNKAMISLREVKQSFSGKKQYTTYGADGQTRSLHR